MTNQDVARASVEVTPPLLAVAAVKLGMFSPTDWAAFATIAYVALQSVFLIWRWWRQARTKALDDIGG